MSIWYPEAGSYVDYLQKETFTKDINCQINKTGQSLENQISKQTLQLVANSEQLEKVFSTGFDSINLTLNWGFNRIENSINLLNNSIETLRADFNYNMGILIEEINIQNQILSELVQKLDLIHKTLERPILTKAREYYKIGCERLSRGLLDKALESFLESEKINDSDFFTQFAIGKLYLYGIDDDDNLIDIEKAKQHMLLAARYGKAESNVDPNFKALAAESYLHASIAVYLTLGEKKRTYKIKEKTLILKEAIQYSEQSLALNPKLSESYYHLAKYWAIIKDAAIAMKNLEKAIDLDSKYAVKVDIDHAFDPIRGDVQGTHKKLRDSMEKRTNGIMIQIHEDLKRNINLAFNESTTFKSQNDKILESLTNAEKTIIGKTFFGYLNAIPILESVHEDLMKINESRIREMRDEIDSKIEIIDKFTERNSYYSDDNEIGMLLNELRILRGKLLKGESEWTYEEYLKKIKINEAVYQSINNIKDRINFIDTNNSEKRNNKRLVKNTIKTIIPSLPGIIFGINQRDAWQYILLAIVLVVIYWFRSDTFRERKAAVIKYPVIILSGGCLGVIISIILPTMDKGVQTFGTLSVVIAISVVNYLIKQK